jgi:hypothetical protein
MDWEEEGEGVVGAVVCGVRTCRSWPESTGDGVMEATTKGIGGRLV